MHSSSGFTIRDLLAVMVVIAALLTLALPATRSSHDITRRTVCGNQLKQLGLGIHNYHDTFNVIPPAGTQVGGFDASRAPRIGWQVRILPFTEQVRLYDRLDMKSRRASWGIVPKPSFPKSRARSHPIPYAMCPEDTTLNVGTQRPIRVNVVSQQPDMDYAQSSYTGNLGSQLVSTGGSCDQYIVADVDHFSGNYQPVLGATNRGGFTKEEVSGIFCERMFGPLTFKDITDGTSNTFAAGEVIGRCNRFNNRGWWEDNGYGNARGQTATPLNILTTCTSGSEDAMTRGYLHPECADERSWRQANFTWGFRSLHPAGANFLMCDGSVQFINNDINYNIYKAYGGRDDGQSVTE